MEYIYHGSKRQGLKVIERRKSTHLKNWVYASKSKAAALVFVNDGESDLNYYLAGSGTDESPLILVERKEGMFEKIFNISGSLYTLDEKNFKSGKTGWNAEEVSEFDEEVIYEEKIDCVLDKLEELCEKDEIRIYRYPDRPQYVPLDNSDLIPKVIRWYKKGLDIYYFYKLYPELKEEFYKQLNE